MIRLSAWPYDDLFAFTVSRDGVDLFTTNDPVDAAVLKLGIDNPLQLIDAARHWGVVEIRELRKPELTRRMIGRRAAAAPV